MYHQSLLAFGLLVIKLSNFELSSSQDSQTESTAAPHQNPFELSSSQDAQTESAAAPHQNPAVTPTSFTFNERTLRIANIENGNTSGISPNPLKKTLKLASSLSGFLKGKPLNPKTAVFNPERREEIFIPFSFPNPNKPGDNVALYIHPWLSKHTTDFEFKGFNRFVTAGCMFGTTLLGREPQQNGRFPIIKHFSKFYCDQLITSVSANFAPNPYEVGLFSELKKLAHFIDAFSANPTDKNLLFHLPSCDYVLYGFELYLRGRITIKAFGQFCKFIFEKTAHCKKSIRAICDEHGIKVTILSPFASLFESIGLKKEDSELSEVAYGTKILAALLPPTLQKLINKPRKPDYKYDAVPQECIENEALLVAHWLHLLSRKTVGKTEEQPPLNTVWADFIQANLVLIENAKATEEAAAAEESARDTTKKLKITSVEGLFGIANPIMIAFAAKKEPCTEKEPCTTCAAKKEPYTTCTAKDYTTCSWLPLSEKPIPVTYAKYAERLPNCYSPTVNITTMDPVTVYSPTTRGPMFYVDEATDEITEITTDVEINQRICSTIHSLLFAPTSSVPPKPQPTAAELTTRDRKKLEKAAQYEQAAAIKKAKAQAAREKRLQEPPISNLQVGLFQTPSTTVLPEQSQSTQKSPGLSTDSGFGTPPTLSARELSSRPTSVLPYIDNSFTPV